MAEGYSINFGKFAVGIYKFYKRYGKSVTKDGNIYQFWKFYIWIKS